MSCPKCGAIAALVIESRPVRDGVRRRRKRCKSCFTRWTEYVDAEGNSCERPAPRPLMRVATPRARKLDEGRVLRILTSPDPDGVVAAEVGVSRQMAALIRTGKSWAALRPDLPRRGMKPSGRTCEGCRHWLGRECDFGFPDPIEEGIGVAADCSMYDRR